MKPWIKELSDNDKEFQKIIKEFIHNETVQEMKNYRQHYETSCFEHCYTAAYYCFIIAKKYHLDYQSLTRAAMLHDLFLYDWRVRQPDRKGLHAFTHGKTAYENSSKIFELNKIEKDMIIKHMWPVTLAIPRYPQTFILTLVDKYCATMESFEEMFSGFSVRKALHYSYVFLALVIFKRKP